MSASKSVLGYRQLLSRQIWRRSALLQHSAVVRLLGTLALEFLRAFAEQTPVLLEDAEVGSVAGFVVACQVQAMSVWCSTQSLQVIRTVSVVGLHGVGF